MSSVTLVWTEPTTASAAQVSITDLAGVVSTSFTVAGTPVTFPYALSTTTKFDTVKDGQYIVSCLVDGRESLGNPDGTKTVRLDNNVVVLQPSLDTNARSAATTSFASKADAAAVAPLSSPARPFGQTMIWGGQAGHPYTTTGGTGTTFNTADTTDFALGTQAIKMTTNGTGQNSFVRKLNGTAMDFTNKVPRIWFKVDNPSACLDFRLWLGSGGTLANAYQWQLLDPAAMPGFQPGEWVALTLPWSAASVAGTPTRNALTDINIQFFDNSTVGTTVHWGGLAMVPDTTAMWPNGVVSFVFDDSYTTHYTQAKTYLDKYGLAGTEYPIIDVIDGANGSYLRSSQLKDMVVQSGWEVGLHSFTSTAHNQTGGHTALTPENQIRELTQSRDYLAALGLRPAVHYAYPQGIFSNSLISRISPLVGSARTTKPRTETWPPSDRMKMWSRTISNTDSAANITAFVDQAKNNKEWLILTFHDITSPATAATATTPAIFQAIVDYVVAQGLAVRTVGEVLDSKAGF